MKGKIKRRGRQKSREDNTKKWTGMDFASSTRAAGNRTRWKGIVAKSSAVHRRPSKIMGYNRIECSLTCFIQYDYRCNTSKFIFLFNHFMVLYKYIVANE